jgi:hypothetical protein
MAAAQDYLDAEPTDRTVINEAVGSTRPDDCYFEGQPDDCATLQEAEDGLLLAAELEAEHESQEAENEAAIDEMEEWCNEHGCEPLDQGTLPMTAPSDVEGDVLNGGDYAIDGATPCLGEFAGAAGSIYTAIGARITLYGMASSIAAGAAVSTLALAGTVAAAMGLTVVAAVAVIATYNCVKAAQVLPPFLILEHAFRHEIVYQN